MTDSDPTSRNWAMAAHLLGAFSGFMIPFGSIVGPLVVWLVKKDEDDFAGQHAVDALNFQITVLLASLICVPLMFILVGFLLLLVIIIGDLVLSIMAAMAASRGETYQYPYSLQLVKS